MTKHWHFESLQKYDFSVLYNVNLPLNSKVIKVKFSLPFRSPILMPSCDGSRYLEISRTGNFDWEFSLYLKYELAESLIICSLSLTAKCIGLTCSDRRELKQKSESEEGWDVTLHRVKCYVWHIQWGRGVVGRLDTCTFGLIFDPYLYLKAIHLTTPSLYSLMGIRVQAIPLLSHSYLAAAGVVRSDNIWINVRLWCVWCRAQLCSRLLLAGRSCGRQERKAGRKQTADKKLI